jgi:hypothetical protein
VRATTRKMALAMRVACNEEGDGDGYMSNGNKGDGRATVTRAMVTAMAMAKATTWVMLIVTRMAGDKEGKGKGGKGNGDDDGKRLTCSVWRCHLPSRTVFFPHFCSATEQTHGGMLIVVCVFPFIFVIVAALLFLYGIMFFVYAHSLGCHQTHFPAPHSFFYICFSLPIHIWFLSILAELEVSYLTKKLV